MKDQEKPEGGELEGKGIYLQQTKLSKSQHERMKMLAEQFGFTTVSSFIRFMCLNPPLYSTVNDIHRILKIIASKEGIEYEEKNSKRK